MTLQSRIVANIKELMEKQGVTQATVADTLGVSVPLVNKLFTQGTALSVDKLEKMAALLRVKPEQLISGEYNKSEDDGPQYPPNSLPALAATLKKSHGQIAKLVKESAEASEKLQRLLGV